MSTLLKRKLGRSGIEVSAVGMGCWAIGGPWTFLGGQAGWSAVDDNESIRAIHSALDLGVTFFDTAANYGCGRSERVLGRALSGRRDKAVIATKFGYRVDESAKIAMLYGDSEATSDVAPHVRESLEQSLRRLGTDHVDVFQLHVWPLEIPRALEVRRVLDDLVSEGSIRTYGWSTDRLDAVQAFSTSPACGVVQQQLNVLDGNIDLLRWCERENLASINRGPLGMGLLTGKFDASSTFPEDDVRKHAQWFPGFQNGKASRDWLESIDAVRAVLTSGGRTLGQGALAWIWASSPVTVPIPGFKTVQQVEENARAMSFGPLTDAQVKEIDRLLRRRA